MFLFFKLVKPVLTLYRKCIYWIQKNFTPIDQAIDDKWEKLSIQFVVMLVEYIYWCKYRSKKI